MNLEVQISWQAKRFVDLEVQISWQMPLLMVEMMVAAMVVRQRLAQLLPAPSGTS